jgi:ketosteroid isomerase-like protein
MEPAVAGLPEAAFSQILEAMSEENVETVERYFRLIDRMLEDYWTDPVPVTEYPGLDEAFRDVQADARWKPPHLSEPFQGRDAWLDFVSELLDAVDNWRIHIDEVEPLEHDHVLVASRNAIRGKGSGIAIDQAIWTTVAVRDGKIAAISDFTERSDALEAVPLL